MDTDDSKIWRYAQTNGFAIITADGDFPSMAKRLGCPPKVVWLQSWDYPTRIAELLMRQEVIRIADFANNNLCVLTLKSAGLRLVALSSK